MGMSAVRYKVMPEGLDVDLESLKKNVSSVIESNEGVVQEVIEEPIAFGLKALIFSFAYPEEKEIDELEAKVKGVEGVSSVELIDYRRAVG